MFFWPLLFYANMMTGGWVYGRFPIRDPDEVTEERIDAFVWGQTFTTGALINALAVGLIVDAFVYWSFRRYRTHGFSRLYRAMKRHQRKVAPHRTAGGAGSGLGVPFFVKIDVL